MKAEDFEKEFLAMPREEQMKVLRMIMPVFCRDTMQDPGKAREMFSLFTEGCCGTTADMGPVKERGMGRKGGGCCR